MSRQEIEAAQSIVMAVSEGRVRAQLLDAQMKAARRRRDRG